MVVVRPDQYVSNVLPLDAHDELADFFARFMLDQHEAADEHAMPRPLEPVEA